MDKLVWLDMEIKKLCPIDGLSSNGRIDFKSGATEQQRQAARDFLVSNPLDILAPPDIPDPIDELRVAMKSDPTLLNKLKAIR